MKHFQELTEVKQARSRIEYEEHDLYCEKCGNKYDYYKFTNGQEYRHGCDCKMIEYAKRKTADFKQKREKQRVNSVFNNSIVNEALKSATFENFKSVNENVDKTKWLCERYAHNFNLQNKQSLFMTGTYGIGKSHLAMSVVKVVKEKGYTALYMNVPQLITTYKDTFNNKESKLTERELDKIIANVDLLVLDDYSTRLTNYAISKLFEIMETRTGKHNIITTNNTLNELKQSKEHARIFSRMMSNATTLNPIGEDYRLRGI